MQLVYFLKQTDQQNTPGQSNEKYVSVLSGQEIKSCIQSRFSSVPLLLQTQCIDCLVPKPHMWKIKIILVEKKKKKKRVSEDHRGCRPLRSAYNSGWKTMAAYGRHS